jgi:N-acetylmuramoyl-L-alanine amidase
MAKLVVLDAGHGGSDGGAAANRLREKDLTLAICKRARDALRRNYQVDVALTRSTDKDLSLDARTDFANGRRADCFVSVHINSGGGEGYEDFVHERVGAESPAEALRSVVHAAVGTVVRSRGAQDRGEKKADFHVLRETTMPAVLTENLFIDNRRDAALLRDEAFLAEVARAHARGIARALHLRRKRAPVRKVSPRARLLAHPRVSLARARRFCLARPHEKYSEEDVARILRLYFETARPVGLDPLLVISQMVLETANLTSFWSQRPRRNPAGIGVTGEPGEGVSFASWPKAVRAHTGRLLAYVLPKGRENSVQRALVEEALTVRPLPPDLRGVAPTLQGLTGTWATDPEYADKISNIANEIRRMR